MAAMDHLRPIPDEQAQQIIGGGRSNARVLNVLLRELRRIGGSLVIMIGDRNVVNLKPTARITG